MNIRQKIKEVLQSYNLPDDEWIKKYGNRLIWDVILSLFTQYIQEKKPEEKWVNTGVEGISNEGYNKALNDYQLQLLEGLKENL